MSKWITSLAGAALALSLNASVWACYTDDGELYSVNTESRQVTVKMSGCGSEKTFTLADKTKIMLNGKAVQLADLKSGDKIKVDYEKADDVLKIEATRA